MSEEKLESIMREFLAALGARDVEKALSFLAEDATWVLPEGAFKGKGEIGRYLRWMTQTTPDFAYSEAGIGIVVRGNKAAYEHVFTGTIQGAKCEWLALCAYEFTGEKIQRLQTAYDRLSMMKQAARGWFEKAIVNSLLGRAEKGLY